jgi:hypothetical protein
MTTDWIIKLWRTSLWGLIGLILGSGLAFAAPPAPLLQIPAAEFDFGEVAEGITVSHAFVIKNTGSEVLKIINVSPG